MSERITCCVPFCRRTYHNREGYSEWICVDHWRLTAKIDRKIYSRRRKLACQELTEHRIQKANTMWNVLKKQAIERAVGI